MIGINIPGWGELRLSHLVLDYNGTIAEHGRLIPGVPEKLAALAPRLTIHILTADTFGTVREQVAPLPCELIVIPAQRPRWGSPWCRPRARRWRRCWRRTWRRRISWRPWNCC
jgi:hypothetical protein